MIVFHKLAKEEIKVIVGLMMQRLRDQMGEHAEVSLTDEATDLLVDKGYDSTMGARLLRRAIQRFIEIRSPTSCSAATSSRARRFSSTRRVVPTTRSTSRSSRAFRRGFEKVTVPPESLPPKATMTPLTRARPSQLVVRGAGRRGSVSARRRAARPSAPEST